jgi:uncharacterized repeat protein (TIGR01451 family)
MLLGLTLAPGAANATKIDNPSGPNFKAEITGGFLQLVTPKPLIVQLPMDFATYDPPLANPTLTGSITTNAAGYGVINVPQANVVFPAIPVDVSGYSLVIRIQPVANATGFIDPLSGRVDLSLPIRLKVEGFVLGQDLGGNCYVGSASSPINISSTTSTGSFPTTNPTPAQTTYVSDFINDGAGFEGGWMAAQPYTDEAGTWPTAPKLVNGFPVGGTKPTPSQIPYDALTEYSPREAGTWRGMNETFAAPAANGCGTGILAGTINDQVNEQLGLPTVSGSSTASFDFKFVPFAERSGSNAMVNKAVKASVTATGLSSSPWPSTQTPTAVSSQSVTLNASTSYFKSGASSTQAYAFDFGSGTFGAPTTNPVASFNAPFIAEGGTPITLPIRVKATDSQGDSDITTRYIRVVPATDITLGTEISSPAGAGKLRAGSTAHIKYNVKNSSLTDSSSQSIAFNAALPSGLSITNLNAPGAWNCNSTSSSITCSLPAGALAANTTAQFDATVDVATGATNPANLTGSAVMTGDPNPANSTLNQNVPVVKTDLAVDVSHSDQLVANGWFDYKVAVANAGDGVTVGGASVDVTLPSDFTYRSQGSGGTGWTCTPADPQHITCTRTSEIAGNSNAPDIDIWARIDRATPEESRTVSASVSTQGDVNAFSGANSDDDTDTVHVLNDLAADVNIAGGFTVGDPGTITYSVTNESVVDGSVATSIESALPSGLTVASVSGPGWDCSTTTIGSSEISCEHAAGINGGDTTAAVTATVDVAQAAYPGQTVPVELTNSQDGFAPNNSDSADVQVRRLDLAIEKLAVKPFNVGIEGRYRLNVTNVGDAATVGDITVTDTLPAGLKLKGVSGAGWDCSDSTIGGSDVICVMTNILGAGIQAAPIEARVDVLDEAAEAGTVINTAYVDTPRDTRGVTADEAITENNESTVSTTAVAVDLEIESRHQGTFRVGTDDLYSLDIRNVGFFGTDPGEPVTVTDDLPEGIVPDVANIEATRPGWTCVEDEGDVTCTLEAPDAVSSAMEPESTVTIDIPVHISDAAADTSENVAEVSTARDSDPELSPNNLATDPTSVSRIDLAVSGNVSIVPRAGGIGEVNIGVHNGGSAATVEPTTVTMPLATGTSYRSSGSTTNGWTCSSPGAGTQVSCVRTQSIAAGGDAPVLKLRTNVGATAPSSWDTAVNVATNGEPSTRLADNDATVTQTLQTIDLAISKSHDPAAVRAGKRANYKIHVSNVGNTASVASYRVEDSVNSAFQNVSASGEGWACSVTGNDVACTRTSSLAPGASAPDITVGFDIPGTAIGSKNSAATVSSTDDPFGANDSAGDPIAIVATADVTVSIDQQPTMRIGDEVSIGYKVTNVGTDSTAGAPSIKLRVGVSAGLKPVGSTSAGDWTCDPVEAAGSNPGHLDCEYSGSLVAGGDTTVNGQFEVVATDDPQTGSLAIVSSPGDINSSNDSATAISDMRGIDLGATVAAAGSSTEYMVAGTTATRQVTVSNDGTSTTTSPIRVSVDLPTGVQFDSSVANGTGWSCNLVTRKVTCERNDQLLAGGSAPVLNLGLRASRSNAPSVDVSYVVTTSGDENQNNDTATRTEEVRYNPDTTITSGPSGTLNSGSATIAFDSDDSGATFACKVDSGEYAACTSPLSLSGLSIGEHVVLVKAINQYNMEDDSPASISWNYEQDDPTGPNIPVRIESTGGTLSLAALGSVDLPENQVKLDGRLYSDDGTVVIPTDGVTFAPVTQNIEGVLGEGSVVAVTISISATGNARGTLPNGGGPATFTMPVRADVTAKLGDFDVIAAGTECALKPVTFDFTGTYDENAGTVHFEQNNVAFPQITGCGTFKGIVDQLLELPRNDIEMALDFKVTKGQDVCPDGQTGTPPDCVTPETKNPDLAKVVVKGPKKVRFGKKFVVRARVTNNGQADASNVKVCAQTPKRRIAGKAKRCVTIKKIAAGKTGTATFRLKAKKAAKKTRKAAARIVVSAPVGKGTSRGKRVYKPILIR